MEELREVIFFMNTMSAAAPDGMNGYHFKKCWQIIKHDLMGVIKVYSSGQMIPKYI